MFAEYNMYETSGNWSFRKRQQFIQGKFLNNIMCICL